MRSSDASRSKSTRAGADLAHKPSSISTAHLAKACRSDGQASKHLDSTHNNGVGEVDGEVRLPWRATRASTVWAWEQIKATSSHDETPSLVIRLL